MPFLYSSPPYFHTPLALNGRTRLKQEMVEDLSSLSAAPPSTSLPIPAETLLTRVGQNADRAAFVSLFNYYAPRLKSYLLKNGADETSAEEIVQSTFVTVWEKAKTYDPKRAAASTWIFTVARNKRIDTLRRERFVEAVDNDANVLTQAAAPEIENYADEAAMNALHTALKALPADQARLLHMSFFEDKSHSAIAKETHLPLGTVKSRLRTALGKLRTALRGET